MKRYFPFNICHLPFISKFENLPMENQWKKENGKWKIERQQGQALVMLLFFIMIGIIITTTAIFIIAGNSLAAGNVEQSDVAHAMAESGAERGLLKIVRGDFTNETINDLPDGTVSISITNGNPIVIVSTATFGSYIKKVEVHATKNSTTDVVSWKETN